MATMDITYSVCFRFIDACPIDHLADHWNSEGFGLIALTFTQQPTRDEFALAVRDALPSAECGKYLIGAIEEALLSLSLKWHDEHKNNLEVLVDTGKPWWFGIGVSWRLQHTPFMFPRPKPLKDKSGRLHVQFN